jgi:hypothetical protein
MKRALHGKDAADCNFPDFYQGRANPSSARSQVSTQGGTGQHRQYSTDIAQQQGYSPVQMVFCVGTRPTTSRSSPVLILPVSREGKSQGTGAVATTAGTARTLLDSAGDHGASARDAEHVLHGHQERLLCLAHGRGDRRLHLRAHKQQRTHQTSELDRKRPQQTKQHRSYNIAARSLYTVIPIRY